MTATDCIGSVGELSSESSRPILSTAIYSNTLSQRILEYEIPEFSLESVSVAVHDVGCPMPGR
ncbi:hypothetical protein CXR23_00010 [Brevibacterium aurantiacum]|uniref:Uncharacterized protein n=1 Tax=Brevibacterium aurantiacum TaxID=273384 RepID=A0A3Q9NP58_BREAU|nr:hypothetical protein CXR23_00010 [Brevibacterium aurantiacum]